MIEYLYLEKVVIQENKTNYLIKDGSLGLFTKH